MTKHWNEVWNKVNRRYCIRHRSSEQPTCSTWCLRVPKYVTIYVDLFLELPYQFFQSLHNYGVLIRDFTEIWPARQLARHRNSIVQCQIEVSAAMRIHWKSVRVETVPEAIGRAKMGAGSPTRWRIFGKKVIGYCWETSGNHLVQHRMPGGVVAAGDIPPATRLECIFKLRCRQNCGKFAIQVRQ